jgi:hypothetical protein
MRLLHLAERFVRALSPSAPRPEDEAWVASILRGDELLLYRRLPNHDRRHVIRGTRWLEERLGADATPDVLAASLLHDVGKYEAGLGPVGRAFATVVIGVGGRERLVRSAPRWAPLAAVAAYARHGERGAEELQAAGAPDLAVRWAAEHHHPERFAEVGPPELVALLDAADHV